MSGVSNHPSQSVLNWSSFVDDYIWTNASNRIFTPYFSSHCSVPCSNHVIQHYWRNLQNSILTHAYEHKGSLRDSNINYFIEFCAWICAASTIHIYRLIVVVVVRADFNHYGWGNALKCLRCALCRWAMANAWLQSIHSLKFVCWNTDCNPVCIYLY